MHDTQPLLLQLAGVVVLGISAQWVAWRLRFPSILALLVFGFLAGPIAALANERFGWSLWRIEPDLLLGDLLLPAVSVSVALILFEGGLTLKLSELRASGVAIVQLVTLGVLVTWVLVALSAWWILGFGLPMALLIGAMLVVTGPTVVGPLLREIRPHAKVGAVAKWEGIVIDPVGATLGVLVFVALDVVNQLGANAQGIGAATRAAALGLVWTLVVGTLLGALAAIFTSWMMRRHWIPDFLHAPVLLMLVVACFVASNQMMEESGLLAVTLMGVIMANQKMVKIRHVQEFKENLRLILISFLFIVLSARVAPEALLAMSTWRNALFLFVLIVLVRPASTWLATLGSSLNVRERLFLCWMAPRGIVAASLASVFALRLESLQDEGGYLAPLGGDAGRLVTLTFLVIIATVTIYGLTASRLAQWLALATADPQGVLIAGADRAARTLAEALAGLELRVVLVDTNWANIQAAKFSGLEAYYGNVLSEHIHEELDLGGLGRFLALTRNDEVNALAAQHFSELFGRAGVFQLTPAAHGNARVEISHEHFSGRFLFSDEATHPTLSGRLLSGAVVKRTRITDEFDADAHRALYGPSVLPLFVYSAEGKLAIYTTDADVAPQPGDTLIALVDPPDEVAAPPPDAATGPQE